MIDENIKTFMDKIKIESKEISFYKNEEKGLLYPLPTSSLLCRVDYLELTKEELEKAKFEQKVDKRDYQMYDCERLVPKSTVTKDKKDQFTITTSKVKATHIYNVSNQAGIHTTLEDKEEAFKYAEEINNKVLERLK